MLFILPLVFTATAFSILNSSMVNVALPTIMSEFGVDFQYSTWLYTGYMLPYAIGMPIFGSLGDSYGSKLVFLVGIAFFSLGSLLCSTADSFWYLLAFRAVQALGASAIMPNGMVLATSPFDPGRRGEILGWWGMVSSAGSLIGPTLGGVLTEHFGWYSIFYVNLPFAAAVLVLGSKYIPAVPGKSGPVRFDAAGAGLMTVSLLALLLTISIGGSKGFLQPQIWLMTVVFLLTAVFFVRREKRIAQPLIAVELFRRAAFAATIIVSFIQSMALFGGLLLIPMFLQHVHEFSPSYSGILVLPLSLTMMIMSPLMGRIAAKQNIRHWVMLGMGLIAVGMGLFSVLKLESRYWVLATALVVTGLGLGMSGTLLSANLVNLVPHSQLGMASGVFNMSRFVGGVIGSTIFGSFMQIRLSYHFAQLGGMEKLAMTEAFRDVYLLAAAVTLVGAAAASLLNEKAVL